MEGRFSPSPEHTGTDLGQSLGTSTRPWPLLLAEAAQSGLSAPQGGLGRGRPAGLSRVLGVGVPLEQWPAEQMAQLPLQDLHTLLSATLFLLVGFSSWQHGTKQSNYCNVWGRVFSRRDQPHEEKCSGTLLGRQGS